MRWCAEVMRARSSIACSALRKDKGLHVADRIVVRFDGDRELLVTADEHRDHIMHETLCTTFERDEFIDGAMESEIDGKAFRFIVTKAVYHGARA